MTARHFGRLPKSKTIKMYFNREAKIQIHNALGFGELYVLEYWLEATGNPNGFVISDTSTALALGLTMRSVKKYRIALQNANLFRIIKTTNPYLQHLIYCFGKEGVYTACYFPDIFGSEINSISKAIKEFQPKGVKDKLDTYPLKPWERTDIYQLFNKKYKGQFYTENEKAT